MKSYIYAIIALLLFTVSCQNAENKEKAADAAEEVVVEQTVVDLSNFKDSAGELVGKQIILTGMIDHVCKHGGQKMFLVNENADARVKIVTGEDMAAFNTELEGESVKVVGIVDELRIDEEYLRDWEEEILAGLGPEEGENAEKVHMGEGEGDHHEHEDGEKNSELEHINDYRTQIAESGTDHISFYSVVCVEYEITETVEVEVSEEGV